MWALRRASLLLRNRGFNVRASCIKSVSATWVEDDSGILESSRRAYDRLFLPDTFYHSVIRRELSSQADDSSTKDQDDLEDGKDKSNDIKDGEKSHDKGRLPAQSEVFKLITNSPSTSVHEHLDNWVDKGKRLSREELSLAMVNLRTHKLYFQALELSKWVASNRDHATHFDLIAQMPQLNEIEIYVKSIPDSPRRKTLDQALHAAKLVQAKTIQITVRHHISDGFKKEAEDLLKSMEGNNLRENSWLGQYLLPLYANLGKADEVGRIWEVCKASPKLELCVCLAAIQAFGLLKRIDDAEVVFEMVLNRWKLSNKDYAVMFKVYVYNNMLAKGKDLFMRMEDSGCQIDPLVWDALVKLHIQAGEIEKAETYLKKAETYLQKMLCPLQPLMFCYDAVVKHYAKRGDYRNADRILKEMKKVGYEIGTRQYKILLEAYANAKILPNEVLERMKVHGIFPDDLFWKRLALNLLEFPHPLFASELLKIINSGKPIPTRKWKPPEKGWKKLNVDGSVVARKNNGAIGGLIRDHTGNFIAGFSQNLGRCDIDKAELKALSVGIILAIELEIYDLVIESDSQNVIDFISHPMMFTHVHHNPLIFKIKHELTKLHEFKICKVYREGNKCADVLARHGQSRQEEEEATVFREIPPFLTRALLHDAEGIVEP